MFLRSSLLVLFAIAAIACGEGTKDEDACGNRAVSKTLELRKDAQMSASEFLQGASIGGVSSDNRRSVTFVTEMPLCVCSTVDVLVSGNTTKTNAEDDVEFTIGLIQNTEVTPIEVDEGASWFRWSQGVPLKTKGHGGLSYSFSLLMTYSFPSIGSGQEDAAELRRLISELDCSWTYMTFTNDPCRDFF